MRRKIKVLSEAGKKGARIRYAKRYDILVELTKYYGKDLQESFIKWPTEYLTKLAAWHRKNK